MGSVTYRDAGVDIDRGEEFASSIRELMQRTFDGRVVDYPGGFAGLFSVDFDGELWRRNYKHPVLVSSTDGVGTKLKIAFMSGRHDTVGIDLVAMCVNDIIVLGAEPLFFLDYLATGRLEPDVLRSVVRGISDGCRQCDCALLGGETAEMPGFYAEGEYDMAGFAVGVVDRDNIIRGEKICPGDGIIALRSSGVHSNGYSLVRKILFEKAGLTPDDSLGKWGLNRSVADALLEPTRIYARPVRAVLRYYRVKRTVHGMAHITGGGLPENVKRILPAGCTAEIESGSWEIPPIFRILQELGNVERDEMFRTFNMGVGFVLIAAPYYEQNILRILQDQGMEPALIGRVKKGSREVKII